MSKKAPLNEFDARLMDAPSIPDREDGMCAICGCNPATNRHHIVPRSHGGTKGPTIPVCGSGNASGCHGMLHNREIHLFYSGGEWAWRYDKGGCKLEEALERKGWRPL